MKERIALALKTKYQRFGLSNEAIDRIASAKEKTVTSEDAIEEGIADTETMGLIASELMKMRDKEIQQRTDMQRAFDAYKEKNPGQKQNDPPAEPPQPAEMPEPEWAKALRERFEREDKEKAMKATRLMVESGLKDSIRADTFNEGIFDLIVKGYTPVDEELYDDAVKRLKAEYDDSYHKTFGNGGVPGLGGQPFTDAKSAVDHKNNFLRQQGLLPQKDK